MFFRLETSLLAHFIHPQTELFNLFRHFLEQAAVAVKEDLFPTLCKSFKGGGAALPAAFWEDMN